MRKNHSKHGRRPRDPFYRWDVVYTDLPQIRGIRRIEVAPLKTIFYNRAADRFSDYVRHFDDIDACESFCDKHGVKLW